MESPVRIKSGAAVLLAICVFLEICNGYPNNQKSNELINSNEPSDSESSTLFVQPQNRPVFSTPRYGPRNATWKFTRKDAVTPIQYITPTPTQGQINITTTLRNEAPTYKTDLPDSVAATVTTINNKIRSRGSIKFGTTRQPFKPKVPHRTMTTLKPEPIETTRPSFIPTNPVSYKDKLNTTNKTIIETKKEKLNNIDSTPRYTRRNSTRLRGEASNKSSVSVTTTLPTVQKIKERYTTTTRRPIEVKKEIISNTILQPRFTRRNTTRLRVEPAEKSSAESFKPKSTTTRVPEVLIASTNYSTTTNKPSEKASESLNSIEVAFDNKSVHEKSVNRSDNIKSIDIGSFEIDKYTSDEFHDVNNVYSQSISPEIEHYIIPENVSDYYVSVGSGSYPQHADNYIHTKSPTSSITGPHLDFFDQQFKEVSESIKQTLDQADYENEQLSTENTEVDPVNFDDLLAEAPNNNTVVSYKNTKEIILNDSKDPLHRSSLHANGKNIYYEKSILSTESYNLTPSTEGPTAGDVPKVKEEISSPPTTPSESNRVEQYAQPDNSNRVQKSEPTTTRRIDFFKNNGTRREFLTTIRMRAHTTPKPRIRISLKTNKNLQNTTAPADKAEDASTVKSPEIVKMFPFSRRRTTLTTVSSNLDPIQQELSSPSRVVDPTKSDQDNSIPTLRKRGSVDSSKNVSIKDNDISSQYTIPPTAWALITLRDAPGSKKTNGPNTSEPLLPLQADNAIKTEDELQKLEKHSDSSVQSNNPAISITYKSNNETPPKSIETNKLNSIPITGPSNSITGPNDGFNKSEDSFKTDTKKNLIPDNDQGYSSYESITKLPSDVTTPVYDKIPESVTSVNFMSTDYFGTGSTDGSTHDDDDEEDAETLSYEMNTEANEETNDYNSGSISNSNLEMTTMNHIPLVELFTFPTENADAETTTQYLTTTETVTTTKDKATTTGDVQETSSVQFTEEHPITSTIETPVSSDETNTIISKKYVTLASTDKTTKTYFDDTSDDFPQSTTNPTTVKTFESTTIPYRFRVTTATTTPDDDLDDFSFTTMYSSTPESEVTTTVSPKIPTEHSNAADVTTSEIKSSSEDIEAASTMYYGTTRANNGDLSTTTFSLTTNGYVTGRPTTYRIPDTESSTLFVTQKSPDSREGKHKIIIDDEDKTANTVNSSDQNNADDWSDTNVDVKSIDPYEINRNNNKTVSENDSSENDTDFNGSEIDTPTIIVRNETQPEDIVTEKTNIEVIKPNLSDGMANDREDERETTPGYGQDMKFDTEDGTGAVAAITISVIGVVALLLLIILLMVARGRRTGGGYGQRCTPVSLDSYSLDNVSVNGSTRRKARRPSKRSYGNPAYDESGATSHPMQFAALTNFSLDQESIVSEFNEIPVITVRADEIPPGCESKNRFSNVIPLPETRVSLKPIAGDETSDYINANYVRGPKNLKNYYIACQAPMASTVTDFWRMIWEQNSRVILMLTEFMENGVEKCFEYIPPSEVSDNKRLFGDYKILVKKREIRDKYIISQLQLKNLNTRTWREVTHIWYFWPAKGVPEECHSIIAFLIEARSYLKASQNAKEFDEDGHDSMLTYNGSSLATNQTQISIDPDESNNSNEDGEVNIYNVQRGEKSKNGAVKNGTLTLGDGSRGGPLVVHCSPGTGRTGAVIACDIGIRDFEMVRTVDVPKTVYKIRRDRANSVQTKDQYIFIYKVLSEYATKLTGGVLDSI